MANYPKCPKCGATGPIGADWTCCACIIERSPRMTTPDPMNMTTNAPEPEPEGVLLPCPFCGGEARLAEPASGKLYIACQKCFSAGGIFGPDAAADATAAWNTRSSEQRASSAGEVAGESYLEFQHRRGRLPNLIESAIEIYDDFMADDDYDQQRCLDRVVAKLKTARDFYDTPIRSALAGQEGGEG